MHVLAVMPITTVDVTMAVVASTKTDGTGGKTVVMITAVTDD
jgi:hypothetical protein